MKLAAKHAAKIASLYNSIAVADLMIAQGHDRTVWAKHGGVAALELQRAYGITPVGASHYIAVAQAAERTQWAADDAAAASAEGSRLNFGDGRYA